ncbi:MAG: transcription termination/antitermination factor NusG [Gemmatimonadetes bacterium]|nr:transcription termination/antitermination factor NusG [Gemmatimonadota bacterium]
MEETPSVDETATLTESSADDAEEAKAPDADEAKAEVTADAKAEEGEAAAPEEGELPDELDERYGWYVVHTYSGHEGKVRRNILRAVEQEKLQHLVPRVLIPMEKVAEMKNGKKTTLEKKFFPSYVLVQMMMSDDAWRVVSNTPGVTRFVGTGSKPQPISHDEIGRIVGRIAETKEKPTPTVPYRVGEHVSVIDGPFTEFTGVVDEVNPERGKLKVMVSIFGRATPVELDFLQVKSL